MYDTSNRVVIERKLYDQPETEISVTGLPAGIYWLSVEIQDKFPQWSKVIISR